MMNYSVVLEHNEEGSWTVTCPVLPGCISEGETKQEALAHIRDAVSLYLRAVQKELTLLKKRHHAQIARIAV